MDATMESSDRRSTRHEFPIHNSNVIRCYSLKFIPREVWMRARKRAKAEHVSIRWVLLTCLHQFADGSLSVVPKP